MIGTEWIVEASGCNALALTSIAVLRELFARVVGELELKPLHEPAFHVFPDPGGITGFVMLSESHLACHTYPEFGIATFNLYCCRPRREWPWEERLAEALGATHVRVRSVDRSPVLPIESAPETNATESVQ
jgi:S-adenosylmethionine decarboxylase